MRRSIALLLLLGVWSLPSNATAAITILTNPAQFSGSETLIDFNGAVEPLTSIGGVSLDLSGFGGAGVWDDLTPREFGPAETTALINFPSYTGGTYPDMTLGFSSLIDRVGFEVRTNIGDNIDITIKSSGTTVGSTTITSFGANLYYFYGLESTIAFDEVLFDVQENVNGAFAMDNLRFENSGNIAAVPEASSMTVWCLLLCCCVALAICRRSVSALAHG